jgi:hypothetical protein
MTQALIAVLALSLVLTIVLESGFFLLFSPACITRFVARINLRHLSKHSNPRRLSACSKLAAWMSSHRSPTQSAQTQNKDLLLVVLVNILTNPVVVLVYWIAAIYTDWNLTIVLILLESFAILTEGYCYKKYGYGFRHPYLFSLAANMFSFWTGVLIQGLF